MGLLGYGIYYFQQNRSARDTQKELQNIREESDTSTQYEMQFNENGLPVAGIEAFLSDIYKDMSTGEESSQAPEILSKYRKLYEMNPDLIGWLAIDGTVIDYPVMQTMENENYYLNLDFYKKENKNGSLILDTDSKVGTGTLVMIMRRDRTLDEPDYTWSYHEVRGNVWEPEAIQG